MDIWMDGISFFDPVPLCPLGLSYQQPIINQSLSFYTHLKNYHWIPKHCLGSGIQDRQSVWVCVVCEWSALIFAPFLHMLSAVMKTTTSFSFSSSLSERLRQNRNYRREVRRSDTPVWVFLSDVYMKHADELSNVSGHSSGSVAKYRQQQCIAMCCDSGCLQLGHNVNVLAQNLWAS